MSPRRVVAALSGGVDSSVAAALAVDAGHDVVGVHLALAPGADRPGSRGCCSAEDARDARRVADVLGIPFYVWDLADEFARDVVDDFVAEYARGRTPNPCMRCNERIKFAAVLDRALDLGFDAVCTGHYARIVPGPEGPELHRAVDPGKDQSYVLAGIDRERIADCLFPLGDMTKDSVRAEARSRGLLVADKPDSHDICFIPDSDTAGFLRARLGASPGVVEEAGTGAVVGAHEGAFAFTIGQRRGLGLSAPTPAGERRYVVDVDVPGNRVVVGTAEMLLVSGIRGQRVRWLIDAPTAPIPVTVQVRAHGEPVPGNVCARAEGIEVDLDRPIRGVAPGQAVVLYRGSRVIGSATIAGTRTSAQPAAASPDRTADRTPGCAPSTIPAP